jgi:tetratricopeptide (TPR) repeat protein
MPWLLTEYVLKGVYLGLLLFVALQEPTWEATRKVALFPVVGLAAALAIAGARKLHEGYRIKGRLAAFILFLLLESPTLVYAGILLGMVAGAFAVAPQNGENSLAAAVGAGAALGVVFWLLRHVVNRWARIGLSLALAVALVGGALYWLHFHTDLLQDQAVRTMFGVRLLLGIPLFYLLTLAGTTEESEVEIGAMCAALGLGAWTLAPRAPAYQSAALLVPASLYVVYTMRILPGLRVFKHVIRGISHAKVGRYRPALLALRRALQLDPQNRLARESLWSMHRAMDLGHVMQDPQVRDLIDLDLCLDRATSLLLQARPGPEKLAEAHRLLDLVLSQRPTMRPAVDYWRAVAHTHGRLYEQAAGELEHLLDAGNFAPGDPYRESVLLQAWQLALTLHAELNRRVGTPQLAKPGRRLEAIGAVERALAGNPDDASLWDLKRLLYGNLTEAEYKDATGGDRAAADFDHGYVHQLGLALINDRARWQRGVEYLRMAARGLLPQAPTIFLQVSQAQEREGHPEAVWQYYELAKRAGQAVGPKNLADEDRQAYFSAVKLLAEDARSREDHAAAIENYQLYSESERSGLETLRVLAELFERKRDVFGALRVTEQALLYDKADKDLLERKDRYYYSVTPDELRARLETFRSAFDVEYCLRKARSLIDFKNADLELIDWAQHLAELVQVVRPDSLSARVIRARALRRKGDIDESRALLEEVYAGKPESFASGAEEEAWFLASRLLGEMYLYEVGRPDLAVPCFQDYRKSSKSGADTLFKLGQAYEQLGDRKRAAKCYEHVTAYDRHPLAPDARDALHRLQSS